MEDDIRFSRPVATADRLGESADDRHRFLEKRVLVTGEPEVLMTNNGRACLLHGLRLLFRICPNIVVSLPTECTNLLNECHTLIDPLIFGNIGLAHTGRLKSGRGIKFIVAMQEQ